MRTIVSSESPLNGESVIAASIAALCLYLLLIIVTEVGVVTYERVRISMYSLQLLGVGLLLVYAFGVQTELVREIPDEKQRSYSLGIGLLVGLLAIGVLLTIFVA